MEGDPIVERAQNVLQSQLVDPLPAVRDFARWIVKHAPIVEAAKAQELASRTGADLGAATMATEAAVRLARSPQRAESQLPG